MESYFRSVACPTRSDATKMITTNGFFRLNYQNRFLSSLSGPACGVLHAGRLETVKTPDERARVEENGSERGRGREREERIEEDQNDGK